MKGPSTHEEDGAIAEINIIPLVDVVLVLLIIFMVTTVFARDSALKLELPKGSRAQQVSQPPVQVTVSVTKGGAISLNGKSIKVEQLQERVNQYRNKNQKTLLVVRGDKNAIYGEIMPVLDELSRTGIQITLALLPGNRK